LLLVFLCVPLTIDFVAFGANKSTYIVISRFFSQLIALAALWLMEKNYFPKQDVFLVNAAQTIILTLLIPALLITSNQLPLKNIISNFFNNKPNFHLLFQTFKDQTPVFLSRIAVIAVVTIEIPMLLLFKNPLNGNVALGNRIAIILLPFIYFYLNKNIDNVREKNITTFAAYVFLICCTIILISPLVVFMLFGESYLHRTNEFNFFIVNILIMSLVNFRFVSTSHDVTSYKYFLSLAPPIAISCIMICILYYTNILTLTNLIMIFYIKNILIIFMSLNVPLALSLRIASMALIIAILNIGLHHFGYFAEISDALKLLAPKLLNLSLNN
jgi:hypothetical protein